MSEEQVKSQDSSSSNKKPKKAKNDELAKALEEIDNLKACLAKLATFTGYQRIVKEYNLEPYEYKADEVKRRA